MLSLASLSRHACRPVVSDHPLEFPEAEAPRPPAPRSHYHPLAHRDLAGDVVAYLDSLRRQVPSRIVLIWDSSPIHHSHTLEEFLADGTAQHLHLERLPVVRPGAETGGGRLAPAQRG
jgi:hypothetical protein